MSKYNWDKLFGDWTDGHDEPTRASWNGDSDVAILRKGDTKIEMCFVQDESVLFYYDCEIENYPLLEDLPYLVSRDRELAKDLFNYCFTKAKENYSNYRKDISESYKQNSDKAEKLRLSLIQSGVIDESE